MRRSLAAALAVAAALLAGCGSSTKHAATARPVSFAGAVNKTPGPAAPLRLRDSLGKPVDIASYRGKAVLVTFIYSHCPDVCPIIVANLHAAQTQLGARARKMQIIAVSTDPRGDTPKAVNRFLKLRNMTGRMEYLLGSRPQLERTWKAWGVAAKADPKNPDAVEHSALIYGISAGGKITTLYPANFKPAQIVHDVPLLAAR
jgi:protein SCO1/2